MKKQTDNLKVFGKLISIFLVIFIFSFEILSCQHKVETQNKNPKYIFLFIGDGMGNGSISLAEAYLSVNNGQVGFASLGFTKFPYRGECTTNCADNLITDSGAAGSAIACGEKANFGVISYYPDLKDNSPISIAKIAKQNGFKVGIITTVGINHATPAVFYAVNKSRKNYYEIGLELSKSNFDFFGGGGFIDDKGKGGNKKSLYEIAKEQGYVVTNSLDGWKEASQNKKGVYFVNPVLSYEADMPYAIDRKKYGGHTLAEIVKKSIEYLYNEKGFFIMVEGGKIDWAAHENDPATLAMEIIDFDLAVKEAVEFYKRYPEQTLIIVTADHDTGGTSLGNYEMEYKTDIKGLLNYKCSMREFSLRIAEYKSKNPQYNLEDIIKIAEDYFYFSLPNFSKSELKEIISASEYYFYSNISYSEEELLKKYGEYNPIAISISKIINKRLGIGFSTWNHTASKVPVYSIGNGAEKFSGRIDNTDFKRIIIELTKW